MILREIKQFFVVFIIISGVDAGYTHGDEDEIEGYRYPINILKYAFLLSHFPGKITPSIILFSISGREIALVRYFSIIKLAIGAAHSAPHPPCSTITAIAILGFSFGAKPTKTELDFPEDVCAVPVLPQI